MASEKVEFRFYDYGLVKCISNIEIVKEKSADKYVAYKFKYEMNNLSKNNHFVNIYVVFTFSSVLFNMPAEKRLIKFNDSPVKKITFYLTHCTKLCPKSKIQALQIRPKCKVRQFS